MSALPTPNPFVEPLHEHDCDACVLLGTVQGVDHYACDNGDFSVELIARRSSEPSDYSSLSSRMIEQLGFAPGIISVTHSLYSSRIGRVKSF